ncbi:hypothetical protein D3C80_996390 [compost metagenome]
MVVFFCVTLKVFSYEIHPVDSPFGFTTLYSLNTADPGYEMVISTSLVGLVVDCSIVGAAGVSLSHLMNTFSSTSLIGTSSK